MKKKIEIDELIEKLNSGNLSESELRKLNQEAARDERIREEVNLSLMIQTSINIIEKESFFSEFEKLTDEEIQAIEPDEEVLKWLNEEVNAGSNNSNKGDPTPPKVSENYVKKWSIMAGGKIIVLIIIICILLSFMNDRPDEKMIGINQKENTSINYNVNIPVMEIIILSNNPFVEAAKKEYDNYKFDKAIKIFSEFNSIKKDNRIKFYKAIALLHEKDIDLAEFEFITLSTTDFALQDGAKLYLAYIKMMRNDFDAARLILDELSSEEQHIKAYIKEYITDAYTELENNINTIDDY